MNNIFDETIVIVKCDSQLELKVMKALKLGKLYKELCELQPKYDNRQRIVSTYFCSKDYKDDTIRLEIRIDELKKEIEVLENE